MITNIVPTLRGLHFSQEEIATAKKEKKLLRVGIELSRICNLQCVYCCENSGNPLPDELTPEEISKVIDEGAVNGAKSIVVIGGGEPLLYSSFWEILEQINHRGLIPVLFTNGTQIDDEIARRLFESNISVITKLNSFDEAVQDRLAGVDGASQKIRKGLDALINAGFNQTNPTRLAIESVITNQNYDEIPAIWRFCRQNNIFPYIETLKLQGRASQDLAVPKEKLKDLFFKILQIDRTEFDFEWTPKLPIIGYQCKQYGISCYVTSQGDVWPCSGVPQSLGNIREKSLREILQSEEYSKLRHIKGELKEPCKSCKIDCYGCRGNAYSLCDDFLAPDLSCWRVENVTTNTKS